MAVVIGQNSGGGAQGYGIAATILGEKSTGANNFNIDNLGPQILDWLKTRMDLSMVRDSPYASRYAVSGVDQGGVPLQPGSGGGGSGSGVIQFNGRAGFVFPAKNDYSVELLSDTSITAPTDGQALVYNGGSGLWENENVMVNPMTNIGDVIFGETGGTPTRLGIGTTGEVLTVSGSGLPAWEVSFQNPMITEGDIIIGLTGGVPARLAAGTNGYVLTMNSGLPAWEAGGGGGFTNPMTTVGDMIFGETGGAATRLGIGTADYGILSIGGVPTWAQVYSVLTPQPFDWGKLYVGVMHMLSQ